MDFFDIHRKICIFIDDVRLISGSAYKGVNFV